MWSHAANPFAEHLEGDRFRVYFSPRDRESRSSVACAELDLSRREPATGPVSKVLGPGDAGAFDDRGTSMGCIVAADETRYLYYLGWSRPESVPWRNRIGLAVSRDGSPFEKVGPGPILDLDPTDPFSLSYPWVLRDGGRWRMWYGSHLNWGDGALEFDHVIKYAESDDGIRWRRAGHVCLDVQPGKANAFARPCVLLRDGRYGMWFSFRGSRYRIGYAESDDGLSWRWIDGPAGLGPDGTGWESESVEYAHVFEHGGRRHVLYCGNDYGATGFGWAVER